MNSPFKALSIQSNVITLSQGQPNLNSSCDPSLKFCTGSINIDQVNGPKQSTLHMTVIKAIIWDTCTLFLYFTEYRSSEKLIQHKDINIKFRLIETFLKGSR